MDIEGRNSIGREGEKGGEKDTHILSLALGGDEGGDQLAKSEA